MFSAPKKENKHYPYGTAEAVLHSVQLSVMYAGANK